MKLINDYLKLGLLLGLIGLTTAMAEKQSVTQNMLEKVLQKNVQEAIDSANTLVQQINASSLAEAREGFATLVIAWKKVQTTYIAGELNTQTEDIPRYIDTYHHGNEDLGKQLERVIASNDEVSVALFKNSYKTINALEYILFREQTLSPRQRKIGVKITQSIAANLMQIKEVYQNDSKEFMADQIYANSLIINAIIDSSYKLREWRVGEAAGLARKYKGKPDNRRLEYFLSHNSVKAIQAILQTQLLVMGQQNFANVGSSAIKDGAKKEITTIRQLLTQAIEQSDALSTDDFDSKATKALFTTLDKLHNSYYVSLVNALSVTAKILDADGD